MMAFDNSPDDEERGVSPVIGVILMVAITVILAAVIAAFVLDLGQSQGANPSASLSFDEEGDFSSDSGEVTITIIAVDRADDASFSVSAAGSPTIPGSCVEDSNFDSAGDTCEVTDVGSDETLTITAEYDGNDAVIQTYEVNA